jgi:hypothetical protein
MSQYVIDAFWSAAQSALTARDVEGLKAVVEQIEAYCGDSSAQSKKVIDINPNSIAKSMCLFLDEQKCFERFTESPGFCPTDFKTKQFREWLIKDGQGEALSQVGEWRHRVGHVMEQYTDPDSGFYKNISRLKTRGHYKLNESCNALHLVN